MTFTKINSYSCSHPLGIAVADVNLDSRLDIVVINYLSDSVGVLLGLGNGNFSTQVTYSTTSGSTPVAVAVADLNQDSKPDIIVANYLIGNIGVLLGYGTGVFASVVTYPSGNNPYSLGVGDFNGDGKIDIVVANGGSSTVGLYLGSGTGTFAPQVTFSTGSGSGPYYIVVADFNQDSRLDIATANHLGDSVGVMLGNGNGTFGAQTTYSTGSGTSPNALAVSDYNQDGRLDIVAVNGFSVNICVLLGLGNGNFVAATTIVASSISNGVAVSDFNYDNIPDIVTSLNNNQLGIILSNGNGTFGTQTGISVTGGPYGIAVGDFNGDSRVDLAVSMDIGNTVDVYLRSC